MSSRLRVLVLASWYPSATNPTAGVFVQQQVIALSKYTDVAVVHVDIGRTDFAPEMSREKGILVVRAGLRGTGIVDRFWRYPMLGMRAFDLLSPAWGGPEIAHVQALYPAAVIARRIRRLYGIPYVITEHSEEYLAESTRKLVRTPGSLRFLLRPLAQRASRVIAVSRYLADRLSELGLANAPLVIPNVVPISLPRPTASGSPHVITHVSNMGPAKNLTALLEATSLLRSHRQDFTLRLVGDGECRSDLEAWVAREQLQGVVEFVGSKSEDEVRTLLGESSFTVISSTHETFSVVAAESLMCGRPVLSTRCGGPEEFVTPEVGLLVEADSVGALTDGLDWMLDHYREFDSHSLHEYAAERFAPDVVAQQLLEVYRSVLDD